MAVCITCGKTIPGFGNEINIKDGKVCQECMSRYLDIPVTKFFAHSKEIEAFKKLDSEPIKQKFAELDAKIAEEKAKREAQIAEEEARKEAERQRILEQIRIKKEEKIRRILEHDKIAPYLNDIYEYDVVTIWDKHEGDTDIYSITTCLEEHAENGWRLISTFANEIGHTSSYSSFSGMGRGTNATIDQIILIFERRIAKAKEE